MSVKSLVCMVGALAISSLCSCAFLVEPPPKHYDSELDDPHSMSGFGAPPPTQADSMPKKDKNTDRETADGEGAIDCELACRNYITWSSGCSSNEPLAEATCQKACEVNRSQWVCFQKTVDCDAFEVCAANQSSAR